MCIFIEYYYLIFSWTLAKIYYFVQLVWNRWSTNDREAVQSDIFLTVNVQMLHRFDNYESILCIYYNWYLFMIFCPIAHHLCMTLPFIICSVVNQCWCVGYESLFTLPFISNDFASVKWHYCRRNPSFIMGKCLVFRWSICYVFKAVQKLIKKSNRF